MYTVVGNEIKHEYSLVYLLNLCNCFNYGGVIIFKINLNLIL
jgi:hypothetical protein